MRCINCDLDLHHSRRILVLEQDVRTISMIAEWIAPLLVTETDFICEQCWEAAMRAVNESLTAETSDSLPFGPSSSSIQQQLRVVGHSSVCLTCGRSVLRIPSELIICSNPTTRQEQIQLLISRRMAPRQVSAMDRMCHNCYRAAGCTVAQMQYQTQPVSRAEGEQQLPHDEVPALHSSSDQEFISQPSSPPSSAQPSSPPSSVSEWLPANAMQNVAQENMPTITLPTYKRAIGSPGNCALPQCNNIDTHTISESLRIRLVKDFKLYLPTHIRICSVHLVNNEWDSLYNASTSSFTSLQIEHIFSFLNQHESYDFEDILNIDDNLLQYWVGLSRENFSSLLEQMPSLSHENMKTGLAALLIKYRNGDSNERIASLMNVPRRTLEDYMKKVRNIMMAEFVPRHLGLSHITRQQMLSHNLLIPNGLYGHNRKPIFIWDGTYTFTYKSSNYSFQKDSYSLHKYRNLLKPMMIVLCDGYILDCLGPYKATTSDAEIMLSLFNEENNYVRNFFRENDVFVLDRGFRDAIRFLEQCGYEPHMPHSLIRGNNQLTTQQANESRCVTICRWVVEVVNGHMKRDYKLFRNEFNNKALPHMMQDFKIAAALYNRFAVRLKDRSDAQNILNTINERFELHNNLADIVASLNLNRCSAHFISITANSELYFPRLTYDELILFSLGTYQMRQAHSYYSEHVKINGAYIIEVCSELPQYIDLFQMNDATEGVTLLRGKIQSRHVGRKIYFVYILINNNSAGRSGIIQYCCNCMVGRRTIGCCAHVMTVVWYLGWARYQGRILPPGQHLSNVFVEDE